LISHYKYFKIWNIQNEHYSCYNTLKIWRQKIRNEDKDMHSQIEIKKLKNEWNWKTNKCKQFNSNWLKVQKWHTL
jgi:hypothetical protein